MPASWNAYVRNMVPLVLIVCFPLLYLDQLKLYNYFRGGITSMHYSLLKLTSVLNSVLLVWKLLAFKFLLGISETFLC
jgi:hypothetical protein